MSDSPTPPSPRKIKFYEGSASAPRAKGEGQRGRFFKRLGQPPGGGRCGVKLYVAWIAHGKKKLTCRKGSRWGGFKSLPCAGDSLRKTDKQKKKSKSGERKR